MTPSAIIASGVMIGPPATEPGVGVDTGACPAKGEPAPVFEAFPGESIDPGFGKSAAKRRNGSASDGMPFGATMMAGDGGRTDVGL